MRFFCILALGLISLHTTTAQSVNQKLRIGAVLTLSGNFASAGSDARSGIETALAELGNSSKIDITFADSKNEASNAISEFRKLASIDHVSAAYVFRAAMAMPLNPISKELGLPLLGAVGHNAFVPVNPFAFQMWPSAKDEGTFLSDQMVKHGHKKIAVVYSEDEWTIASTTEFRKAFGETKNDIVFDQSVLSSETDFQTILLKIKSSNPDGLYVHLILPQLARFFRQAHELHIHIPSYTNFYIAKKEVLEAAGSDAVQGINYYDIDAALSVLQEKVTSSTSIGVPPLTAVSYITTYMLNQAARESASSSTSDMYKALLNQHEIRTPEKSFLVVDRYLKIPLVFKTINSRPPG